MPLLNFLLHDNFYTSSKKGDQYEVRELRLHVLTIVLIK